VAEVNAAGRPVYSTYLGGSGRTNSSGIAVTRRGTPTHRHHELDNFPTANPPSRDGGGNGDAFVRKLTRGSALVYPPNLAAAAGRSCRIAVTRQERLRNGLDVLDDFPTATPSRPRTEEEHTSGYDAFVAKLNAAGSALDYSHYLGGSGDDGGSRSPWTRREMPYVTASRNRQLPDGQPLQAVGDWYYGDAFVAELNARVGFATHLPRRQLGDFGSGIAVGRIGERLRYGPRIDQLPTANPLQAAMGRGTYDASWRDRMPALAELSITKTTARHGGGATR